MVKKIKFFLISTVLLSLFSASALAVSTPGSAVKGILNFFKGVFTGTASLSDAYLISFILYFVIFLAIFIEGIRIIPLFGGKGKASTPGKAFAIAAAALATIALFMINMTPARLAELLAPFGIWGGTVIAAIIALITFKFIRDSEAFEDSIILPIAISASIGVTLLGLILTMDNLFGWGFFIMILSFIMAGITAFFKHRGTTADARKAKKEAETEREVGRFKKKDEERKKKKEAAEKEASRRQKEDLVSPAKEALVKAVEASDEALKGIFNAKTDNDRKEILKLFKVFNENMENSWKSLHLLRRRMKGEERKHLTELIHQAEAIAEHVNKNVKGKLPKMGKNFLKDSAGAIEEIKNVRRMCHDLWNKVEAFHS